MKRLILTIGAIVVLFVVGVSIAARKLVDPQAVRRDLIAGIERQTGRTLRVGQLDVSVLPWPSLRATDVSLSDPPDFAHPLMLQMREVRASIAPWPLLTRRLRLENVTAIGPRIWLARNEAGVANWRFHPRPQPAGPAGPSGIHHAPWALEIGSARVLDGAVAWRDAQNGASGAFGIDQLDLDGLVTDAPWIALHARRGDTPFTLTGHIGPLSVLHGVQVPWPVSLGATLGPSGVGQDQLNLDGQIANIVHGRGFDLTLRGAIAQLRDFEGLFPHAGLPDVRGIAGDVRVSDDPTPQKPSDAEPDFSERVLGSLEVDRVHLSVSGAQLPYGLTVRQASLQAEGRDQPLTVSGGLSQAGHDWQVSGKLGSLGQAVQAVRSHLASAMPVSLTLSGAQTTLGADGTLGGSRSVLDIAGHAPDILADTVTLHDVALRGHFESDGHSTLSGSHLLFSSREAALDGDLTWTSGTGRPVIAGSIHASLIDLDALQALWAHGNASHAAAPAPAAPPVPPTVPQALRPQTTSPPAAQAPAPASQTPPLPELVRRLRRQNADLSLTADRVLYDHVDYSDITAHVALKDGHLRIDPLSGKGPDTSLAGTLDYDASRDVPVLNLTFSPLILPSSLIERTLGIPTLVSGPMELVGALAAQGDTKAALRDSMSGHLGASVVDGRVDSRELSALVGRAVGLAFGRHDTDLRCFGTHMNIASGQATIDTIGLAAGHVAVTGKGTVGLADQALSLDLTPSLGFGGGDATAPVTVTGTVAAPHAALGRDANGRFNLTIGGAAPPDPCIATLAAAREGASGPAPQAAPAHHSRAGDLLRSLGILH